MSAFFSRKLLISLAGALSALLLVAACGGGDDDDDDSSGSGATATATATASESGGGESTDEPTETPGNGGGSSGLGFDVCDLLTPQEIEDVTGIAAKDGVDQTLATFYACSWEGDGFDAVDVTVLSRDDGGEDLYEFNNDDAEMIDGLGDRAQYLGGILPSLEVLTGDYYISVSVNALELEDDQAKEDSIELARAAIDRLP